MCLIRTQIRIWPRIENRLIHLNIGRVRKKPPLESNSYWWGVPLKELPLKKQNSPNRHVTDREALAGTRSPTDGCTQVIHSSLVTCQSPSAKSYARGCADLFIPAISGRSRVVVDGRPNPSLLPFWWWSPRPPLPLPPSSSSPPSALDSPIAPSPFRERGPPSTPLRLPPGRYQDLTRYTWHEGGKIHKMRVCALVLTLSCATREYKRPSTEMYRTIPRIGLWLYNRRE